MDATSCVPTMRPRFFSSLRPLLCSLPLLAFLSLPLGCDRPDGRAAVSQPTSTPDTNTTHASRASTDSVDADALLSPEDFQRRYPWAYEAAPWPRAAPLDEVFSAPEGFARIAVSESTFADFVRHLPLRLDRTAVHQYNGRPVGTTAAAIVMLPVGDRNLQQCADAILRLHAEHLWATDQRSAIAYHFTSGDRSAWTKWADGERFRVDGNRVERYQGAAPSANRSTFQNYLTHLFTYAGTRSLSMDAQRVPVDTPIQPGDFFLDPGSPGHVVLVLDVVASEEGERRALLGQSFMPAQEFHVIEGGVNGSGWFDLPDARDETLNVPAWTPFPRTEVWRFE